MQVNFRVPPFHSNKHFLLFCLLETIFHFSKRPSVVSAKSGRLSESEMKPEQVLKEFEMKDAKYNKPTAE